MITVALIQAVYVFCISSDTLKEWGRKFKEQHKKMMILIQWCDGEMVK